MGSSFGAVASLSTAYRHPDTYGSLLLQSGSFVFTDIGTEHGGGPVFDPVVRFVNRYRARPRRSPTGCFVSCGVYEPLIVRNRSMVPTFGETGMRVRLRRVPRRPQLGELARPAPGRAVLDLPRPAEVRVRVSTARGLLSLSRACDTPAANVRPVRSRQQARVLQLPPGSTPTARVNGAQMGQHWKITEW